MYKCINPRTFFDKNTGECYSNEPCGECYPCQMRKRAEWDLRLQIEAMHSSSCAFVTFTYDDEYLPSAHDYRNFQLLHKCMRNAGISFTFYHISEFGTKKGRPHNHELYFFKSDFDHLLLYNYYHKGIMDVGTCTPASIHYVTKWHVHPKYRSGESKEKHGFSRCSKGLGSQLFFDSTNFSPTYKLNGHVFPVSRYYRKRAGIEVVDFLYTTIWEDYHKKYPFASYCDFLESLRQLRKVNYNNQFQIQDYGIL